MKLKIMFDDGERELDLKPIKGRHVKKLWKYFETIMAGMEKDDMKPLQEYMVFVDTIASEISGLTVEQLDDLDIDEKDKITKQLTDKAFSMLNFTMPSLQQGN